MADRNPDPGGSRDDPELAELVEELSTTLGALRDALDGDSGRRRVGPPGPTPPAPRALLRFTEQYTIPTLISVLEAGVRSLELLRATLRLLDGRGLEATSPATRERVESVGRTTVDRVDRALSELGSAVEGEPTDPDARDLLADARALRDEIDDRLREAEDSRRSRPRSRDRGATARRTSGREPTGGRDIPVQSGTDRSDGSGSEEGEDGDVPVDVDAELESIREDVARERDEPSPDPGEGTDDPDASGGRD